MTIGDEIDCPDLMAKPVWAGCNLSRTREIGRWRVVSPPLTVVLRHRRGGCPRCAARLAGAPLRASRVTVVRVFLGLKHCGDIGVLTQGSMWWGMTSRWLTAVAWTS
jgi:hypothetical protein